MKIDRALERRSYEFYKSIDNYINKLTGSIVEVQINLLNILMYVIQEKQE